MAIVGALEDGLSHNYTTLFAKSIMDGVLSVVFAAAMGIGVAFSMIPVGIYQGGITLLAGVVKPYLTELMIGRMSCIGSILIFALGLNLTTGSPDQDREHASGSVSARCRVSGRILNR